MHEVEVSGFLPDAPDWWKNFILENKLNTIEQANLELERHHATVTDRYKRIDGHTFRIVQFKTEPDFVAFKLKYSGK